MKRAFSLLAVVAAACLGMGQGHGGSHFRFAGSDGGSLVQLALRPDVQKELNLSDDQKAKMADLENRMQTQVSTDFKSMEKNNIEDPNTMRHTISETGEKYALELPNVLNADQNKRLRELLIQRSGYSSLERKDVQDELGFSDEQKAKVSDTQKTLLKTFDSLMEISDAQKRRDTAKAAMETLRQDLKAIMSADQAAKFEQMKGKPFTFDEDKKMGG